MENKIILSALLRKARRDRARDDILYFAEYYLPHLLESNTPLFHKEIYQLLQTENRVAIAAPRGFAKSTITQIIYGLYCLLYHDGEDILTISQSSHLADDWVRKIKFELEGNQRIKTDFQTLLQWGEKDSKRWTADHLVLQKEGRVFSQVRARGRGCQVRGLRPTKVICDDLEDEELVRSEEQRQYLKEWFLGALLNVLKTDQQLIVIGTILHPIALLADIISKKEQFEKWVTKKYKALEKNKSLWQDRFPVKDLLKRKFEIGTYAFETEFQNNPIASDICLWRPEWIKEYDKAPKILYKFAAIDPAISIREQADYTAMCCIGVGQDEKLYELETVKGRWGTWDLVDRIISFFISHQPIRIGVEEIAFQQVLRPLLIRESQKRGIRIPIEPITLGKYTGKEKTRKTARDKRTRALSVIHYWEQNAIFLKTEELIDQLRLFPTGSEDDMVDACVWAVKLIDKHSPIKIMVSDFSSTTPAGSPKSFEVKDNQIPCLAPMEDIFKPVKDWRLGG